MPGLSCCLLFAGDGAPVPVELFHEPGKEALMFHRPGSFALGTQDVAHGAEHFTILAFEQGNQGESDHFSEGPTFPGGNDVQGVVEGGREMQFIAEDLFVEQLHEELRFVGFRRPLQGRNAGLLDRFQRSGNPAQDGAFCLGSGGFIFALGAWGGSPQVINLMRIKVAAKTFAWVRTS